MRSECFIGCEWGPFALASPPAAGVTGLFGPFEMFLLAMVHQFGNGLESESTTPPNEFLVQHHPVANLKKYFCNFQV